MSQTKITRRSFLERALVLGAAAAGGGALLTTGCKKDGGSGGGGGGDGLDCTDTSGLTQPQIQMRNQLAYVDNSPEPDKNCANCQLYTEPEQAGTCGGCTLLAGPIHPDGYCTSWAAKQPAAAEGSG